MEVDEAALLGSRESEGGKVMCGRGLGGPDNLPRLFLPHNTLRVRTPGF